MIKIYIFLGTLFLFSMIFQPFELMKGINCNEIAQDVVFESSLKNQILDLCKPSAENNKKDPITFAKNGIFVYIAPDGRFSGPSVMSSRSFRFTWNPYMESYFPNGALVVFSWSVFLWFILVIPMITWLWYFIYQICRTKKIDKNRIEIEH